MILNISPTLAAIRASIERGRSGMLELAPTMRIRAEALFSRCLWLTAVAICGPLATPAHVFAQSDRWQADFAPLYVWAATTNGNLAINGTRDIPIHLDFADAKSKLAGAFSFHGEARRGQWGMTGDVNFLRLSTDVNYTVPIINEAVSGTLKLDQVIFNGKVMYEVKRGIAL